MLDYTLKRRPRDGSTHWSSRKLAGELGITFMDVQRIWRRHDLKPHRLEGLMVSNDPDFEVKAADVIGLYLNLPANAAVFCVDEKTAIQALDRKDRMLPLSPGRAESHGFESHAIECDMPKGLGPDLNENCALSSTARLAAQNAIFMANADVFGVVKPISSFLDVRVSVVRHSRSPVLKDGPPEKAGGTSCAIRVTASIRQSPRSSVVMLWSNVQGQRYGANFIAQHLRVSPQCG